MTARIRDAFGVEPFNTLGLTETGITAIDCAEHQGLHLFEDSCLFEVVDAHGRPVPPGRPGDKVLVTNLDNHTQPFIRFEVTDLVTVTDEPCACGRTFRRITALEGRSDDVLELAGRGRRHGARAPDPSPEPARRDAGGRASTRSCTSRTGSTITLALAREAAPEATARDVERTLAAALHALGAAPLPIRVRVVPHIEREAGAGKFKLIKAAAGAPAAGGSA